MFIDFVEVENFARQFGVPNKFSINKINKHLISNNHFKEKNSGGLTIWCIDKFVHRIQTTKTLNLKLCLDRLQKINKIFDNFILDTKYTNLINSCLTYMMEDYYSTTI